MRLLVVLSIAPIFFFSGCSRESRAPEPIPLTQFTAEVDKAFRDGSPPAKELSRELTGAVRAGKFAAAQQSLQVLLALDDLTQQQRAIANRAMLTVMAQLQAAEAKGDTEASAAIQKYRSTR